ncbi:MAG: hypothetical protein Greene041619_685 [Candidatus Peregrinibacteria bacterium Greene0416_19]|nr:MAG: hypothetical protein Greene041619_685 [Candidatus Peregrinibacteria bacterium Greene0416_19]
MNDWGQCYDCVVQSDRSPFTVPAAILGISIVLAAGIAGHAAVRAKNTDTISITGSAQRRITSDAAKWRLTLSRQTDAAGLRDASAQVEQDLRVLKSYLKKSGLPDAAVTVAPVSVDSVYTSDGPAMYNVHQDVVMESEDVAQISRVAQGATALLTGGAVLSTTGLEFYYSKLAELKIAMLAEATRDAQMRAARIAESAGSRLGKLKSAAQGVFQITPVHSTDVEDYGMYDTSTVEKQITSVVRATFTVR